MVEKNIIMILGNGFDIAHDFPTRYSDFANHLLIKIGNKLIAEEFDSSFNLSFKKFLDFYKEYGRPNLNYINSDFLVKVSEAIVYKKKEDINVLLSSNSPYLSDIISSSFLARLFSNNYTNWFDIENAFFEELVKIENEVVNFMNKVKQSPNLRISGELKEFIDKRKKEIKKLNNELKEIKAELKLYLNTIDLVPSRAINKFFSGNFKNRNNKKKIHFVNFNYTNTIDLYLKLFSDLGQEIDVLNIHGTLKEDIIFGYGNDRNIDYKIMKELQIDEFLENFKTFEYLNKDKYSNFFKTDLPELKYFDVYVIGHSLQQTDKTLLSGIFNNNKCKEIHLLKRGDLDEKNSHKEYRRLVFALSRILEDENDELRLKVVDFENTKTFPL